MPSRHASPSTCSPSSSPLVSLDNLEVFQDKWIQRYEKSRRPPPPPTLNSPRSLRACAVHHVDPSHHLQKLSLRQQLNLVMGTDINERLQAITQGDASRTRVAMQTALHAFQQAAIGLGTSHEKLVAYHTFEQHEKTRLKYLSATQQTRQQLVAGEGHTHPRQAQTYARSSPPRTEARREPTAAPVIPPLVPTLPAAVAPSADQGPRLPQDPSGLTGTASRPHGSATPPARVAGSPKAPYTPRNAEALNASVFGNRTFLETTCNPSGIPLSASKDSQERRSQGADTSAHGRRTEGDSHQYTPLSHTGRRPTPTQKTLFPVYREEDSVVSLDSANMDWVIGARTPAVVNSGDNMSATIVVGSSKSLPLATDAVNVDAKERSLGANSRRSSSARTPSVAPITHLEQDNGIFYYCANPQPLFSGAS